MRRTTRFNPAAPVSLAAAAVLAMTAPRATSAPTGQPPELGRVEWGRDYAAARDASRRSGRPVLVLFDEVPGCHTCVSYGETALSHPLVVEAAGALFEPVFVHNNVDGAERAILESFGEPAWNNPVVRIVDDRQKDLAPRLDGDYTPEGLAATMVVALERAGRETPLYLRLVAADGAPTRETAVFAMHCFWEGEAKLGAQPGVLSTRTGMLDGREVVEVVFDPDALAFPELLRAARSMSCADRVYIRTDEQAPAARAVAGDAAVRSDASITPSPKDDKYSLRQSEYRFVPMTPAQASRVNAALAAGGDPAACLSPTQARLAEAIRAHPDRAWPAALEATDLRAALDAAYATAGITIGSR